MYQHISTPFHLQQMANRAYLYSANTDLSKLRDISEHRSDVPLVYKILLGINPALSESKIWGYEHPIAIKADFKKGLQRLYDFYDYLTTQEGLDKGKIATFKKDTQDFFQQHEDRVLDLFFMEGGEAYDLIASENYPIEKENEYVYLTIKSISANIAEILTQKPQHIFENIEKYPWLKEIKADINVLEPYWTHVTYFSFNKS